MFADIEADIYVLVDGDDTYDAFVAPALVRKLVDGGLDIVSGRRIATGHAAYRAGHVLGNRLLTGLTALMFSVKLGDLLTGYRIMSRRFVKSFPFTAEGFGIETELTVHAVRLLMPMVEMDTKLQGAARRFREQAEHLPRRRSDFADDHLARARGTAAHFLQRHFRDPRDPVALGRHARGAGILQDGLMCRACPPRCWPPH